MSTAESPSICDLPVEVLSHIFSFLAHSDIKEVRLVCNQWYKASLDLNLLEKEIGVSSSECCSAFQDTLLESNRDFLHLSIREDLVRCYDTDFPEHQSIWNNKKFWSRFGPKLRSLTLHNCKLNRDQFLEVLRFCTRLRFLEIVACTNLFRWDDVEPSKKNYQRTLDLPNLQSLKIAALYNPEAELFDIITSSAPNLRALSLDECLYPIRLASPSGLTSEHIQTFLDKNPESVFDLNLRCLEGDDFNAFIELVSKPNVRLRSLEIHYNYSIAKFFSDKVMDLITSQKCLEELELSCEVGDLVLGAICNSLTNLKILSLLFCSEVVRGAGFLFTLKKLTSLKMMECYKVTSSAVICGLCGEVNRSLRSLTLTCGDLLSPAVVVEMARTHPNLIYLDLSNCEGVTNSSVQAIFRHLVALQSLVLSSCKNLDDAGLCARISGVCPRLYPTGYSLWDLKGYRCSNLKLPSHIDAFMWRDVFGQHGGAETFKNLIRHIRQRTSIIFSVPYWKIQTSRVTHTNFSYLLPPAVGATGSREFNMAASNISYFKHYHSCSIDGTAFKSGLRIQHIRHIVLNSNEISSEALKCFVSNNRTIESLEMAYCEKVTDDVLDGVGYNLFRLKRINLEGCTAVTKEGIKLLRRRIEGVKVQSSLEV